MVCTIYFCLNPWIKDIPPGKCGCLVGGKGFTNPILTGNWVLLNDRQLPGSPRLLKL